MENRRADNKENENSINYWNCYMETGYKECEIYHIAYIKQEKFGRDALCFTVKNGVVLWVSFMFNQDFKSINMKEFGYFRVFQCDRNS